MPFFVMQTIAINKMESSVCIFVIVEIVVFVESGGVVVGRGTKL